MAISGQTLRQRLLQERQRLLEEIDALGDEYATGLGVTTGDDYYGNHPADIGTETFEHEKQLALEKNLRRLLQATEDALQRLDEGRYGVCANCGQQIPMERLEALPQATLCIECKRKEEAQG